MSRPSRLLALALLAALACGSAAQASAKQSGPNNSNLNSDLFYQLLVGELSAQSGDNGSAYALMLDAAHKTNSPRLYERAVELALQARNGESALEAAQSWARAYPTSLDANRYLLQILIGLNRIAETQEPLRRGLAALPPAERAAAIDLVPRYYARATDRPLTASVVEKALASELGNRATGPAAWASIGVLRLQANDADGALEAARRGVALNPKAQEPVLLALAMMNAKRPAAEALVQKYLSGQPQAEIRMAYTRNLLNAQRYADAYAQTLLLNAEKPDMAEAWLVRGSLELQDKKVAQAESSLKTYVAMKSVPADAAPSEMDRGLVQAYLLLAQIAEQNQRPDEALAYLSRIDSPQDALRVQSRRAAILAHQGKLAEARALIRSTPETQPEDARAKISAEVQLLREARQYQDAYEVLYNATAQYPEDMDLVYDQAMMAEKIGRPDEMEVLLRRVIATKPDYHHAYNALGYSFADRGVRLVEARELITKALEFAPNDPFIVDSLAWVEFRSGNPAEAARLLQGAYKARPDAEIAAHLGEVLWSLGQRDEANTVWAAGLALSPENETLLETMKRLRGKP